jgi:creatinine amidohydrolase
MHPDAEVIWHDWWNAPEVGSLADSFDPVWSHASWPNRAKERVPLPLPLEPRAARRVAGDGSFGGLYARPDEEVLALWRAGVEGVRALLESGWGAEPSTSSS